MFRTYDAETVPVNIERGSDEPDYIANRRPTETFNGGLVYQEDPEADGITAHYVDGSIINATRNLARNMEGVEIGLDPRNPDEDTVEGYFNVALLNAHKLRFYAEEGFKHLYESEEDEGLFDAAVYDQDTAQRVWEEVRDDIEQATEELEPVVRSLKEAETQEEKRSVIKQYRKGSGIDIWPYNTYLRPHRVGETDGILPAEEAEQLRYKLEWAAEGKPPRRTRYNDAQAEAYVTPFTTNSSELKAQLEAASV